LIAVDPSMRSFFYAGFGLLVLLHLGAIRKNEDPIAKTQTDPISYKQKLEETKDGVKGAPTPSFKYYEKEEFLVKTPMETGLEEKKAAEAREAAEVSEVDFEEESEESFEVPEDEDLGEETGEASEDEEEWWVEDETGAGEDESAEYPEEAER
jgi:hypothetical protein